MEIFLSSVSRDLSDVSIQVDDDADSVILEVLRHRGALTKHLNLREIQKYLYTILQ